LSKKKQDNKVSAMLKIVYFDEETASDYLDITSGGKITATAEDIRSRSVELSNKFGTSLAAKLSWLPFLGASANIDIGGGGTASGNSLFKKTLSNTILTDYLSKTLEDDRIVKLRKYRVVALKDSMAYVKMFTPYMMIMKTEESGVDLGKLDQALTSAKGYYELLGEKDSERAVLRFNLQAFRNNYGLTDLPKMDLVFHAIRVGSTCESNLTLESEMNPVPQAMTATDIVDDSSSKSNSLLNVYDVVFAGIEHAI
jgi:hypothetical protein